LDIDDALGMIQTKSANDKAPKHKVCVEVGGKQVHKSTTLNALFAYSLQTGSMDRNRQVMGVACFAVAPVTPTSDFSDDVVDDGQDTCTFIQDPAITLVHCEGHLFLAIIMIDGIKCGTVSLPDIPTSQLIDDEVVISFQILQIEPQDLHDGDNDWVWK
jgi:hypothetical protein